MVKSQRSSHWVVRPGSHSSVAATFDCGCFWCVFSIQINNQSNQCFDTLSSPCTIALASTTCAAVIWLAEASVEAWRVGLFSTSDGRNASTTMQWTHSSVSQCLMTSYPKSLIATRLTFIKHMSEWRENVAHHQNFYPLLQTGNTGT